METLISEYASLCFDYIKGNTEESLKSELDNLSFNLYQEIRSDTIIRIHLDALIKAICADAIEIKCFERYYELVKMTCHYYHVMQVQLIELTKQVEQYSGTTMGLMGLKQYLEDTGFMLSRMAEMTEYLDGKITQLSPYEIQLLKLQQISHTIIQNADFGVLVVDSSFTITMINKAAAEILGIPENAVGATFSEIFSGHTKETAALMLNALSGERHQLAEVKIKEQVKALEIVADKLVGKEGEKEGGVALIYDISESEAEKRAMEENIKLATVGKLAAGVAHEIRNPLTVIKGFSQLLLSKYPSDSELNNYLKIICGEAERANSFIQDFLKLGKPQEPRRRIIDAREIVLETVALMESQCFINGIEIVQKLDTSGEIVADPDQIKQVLINLAKNSIEAMEGSVKAKKLIFEIAKDTAAQVLQICVHDTGCGIPPEILEKITTPFFTTKRFGTGLGLNISQGIIERHGGRLKFLSNGHQTTASIELPLRMSCVS